MPVNMQIGKYLEFSSRKAYLKWLLKGKTNCEFKGNEKIIIAGKIRNARHKIK